MSLEEYLALCKSDPGVYASAPERMLMAIGEPELVDTSKDPRLSRIFSNKMIRRYPAFDEFYGLEDVIENIVSYFRHAAQGLEEKKQILYLLGPVGGGKSSLAEKLKALMQKVPFYAIKDSPVNESPLCLFDAEEDGPILEEEYGIPRRYVRTIMSPWAVKRLKDYGGDLSRFRVVRRYPSILDQVAVAKTEPGDENNQDISSLVGKVDKAIRSSGLGLNPVVDGTLIRLPIPELNEERRRELVKVAGQYSESAKVAVRNVRRDGMDMVKKAKAAGLSEDDAKFYSDEIQAMTDATIKKIDQALETKQEEIMQV